MQGMDRDGLYNESGYRVRCMKGLLEQVERDYGELSRLWERFEKGNLGRLEEKQIVRVLAWLGQELRIFKEFRNRGLEGVRCVEIEKIEKDVRDKMDTLKALATS